MSDLQASLSLQKPLTFSIGGGKGGVGKSMVSSNLAIQYAQAGMRVILLDLDFGAANIHTIFGIKKATQGIGDYLYTKNRKLSQYVLPTYQKNLSMITGGSFFPEMANIKYAQKIRLMKDISHLEADIVILDLGAGTSQYVIDLFSMTDTSILVTTSEPTAIVNMYEFLKNVIYRMLLRIFYGKKSLIRLLREVVFASPAKDIESKKYIHNSFTITQLIERVGEEDAWAAEIVREACHTFRSYIILNQARRMEDISIGEKLHQIAKRFLYLDILYGGVIFSDEQVSSSILRMLPISIAYPDSTTSKTLHWIAKDILLDIRKDFSAVFSQEEKESLFSKKYQKIFVHARDDFRQNFFSQKEIERSRKEKYAHWV